MSIGNIIREYRKSAHMTQAELGEKVYKSAQVISNWERGYTTGITPDDLTNISSALGIQPGELLKAYMDEQLLGDGPRPASQTPGYFLDPETVRLANEMKENPGRRVLFDATRNLSPEKIKQVKDFVDFITRDQNFSE